MRGQERCIGSPRNWLTCSHSAIGKVIYNKVAGYDAVGPDAHPLRDDAVFKYASATKLITSIALLQCIDQGLIGLDEPVNRVVPELGKTVITGTSSTGEVITAATKNKITPRHLLTHTFGLAYWFLNPLLMKWKQTPEGAKTMTAEFVHERCDNPLVFEPGQGWAYGPSLDWAGVIVKRLHGNISLEDYMIEHIWKQVGLSAPYPTFCISKDKAYQARLMGGAVRCDDGSLEPYDFWQGNNAIDQDGGHGLSGTAQDWLAVLADLVSDDPKLLKPETVAMLFEPQIPADSPAIPMLRQMRPAWEIVTGHAPASAINHSFGGIIVTDSVMELQQPKNMLGWGGAANTIWFASREHGVAGFFGTQLHPFSDPAVKVLVNAWKRDFWSHHVGQG